MATKKITMKQKTSQGYDILHPATTIEQVSGLQSALDEKLYKSFSENYSQKSTIVDNDLLAINNSEDSNKASYIKASQLKSFVQDPHNKGYYATVDALKAAYPTATAGDFAIVGETDTIWVWNDESDKSGWVNTDTHGEVTSVNGQTGAVTVPTPGNLTCGDQAAESMAGNITLAKVAKTGSYNDLTDKPAIQKIVVAASEPSSMNVGDFWYEEINS
ncbi:MAG: hypothetical protein MJZ72_07165 [Bacteroidales bacterium]|nr:hypothetical protein [Bacteroidales bacterium]